MHRFEQRREVPIRIQVGRRCDSDGPRACRAEIGEDVAKQVGCHHHIKALRTEHKARGQDIDVVFVGAHLGVMTSHGFHPLVPVRHADRDPVGLGRRGQVLLRPALGKLEGVLQDAIHAAACEDRFLQHRFALRSLKQAATHGRILALGVFTHDHHVDVAHLAIRQRTGHAGHEADWAQVNVLVELAPELEQRAPQRDVVGHLLRPAHRAKEDRIEGLELLEPIVRHHLAVCQVVVTVRPVKGLQFDANFEPAGRSLQRPQPFGHDFLTDAIPGNHCNPMRFHESLPLTMGSHEHTSPPPPRTRCCVERRSPNAKRRGHRATEMPADARSVPAATRGRRLRHAPHATTQAMPHKKTRAAELQPPFQPSPALSPNLLPGGFPVFWARRARRLRVHIHHAPRRSIPLVAGAGRGRLIPRAGTRTLVVPGLGRRRLHCVADQGQKGDEQNFFHASSLYRRRTQNQNRTAQPCYAAPSPPATTARPTAHSSHRGVAFR